MMRTVFFLLLTMSSLMVQPIIAAESLGRLFSTPEERSSLDRLRETKKNQPIEQTVVDATVIESRPVALPNAVNMQGYVKRSDGKLGTVWVNGEAIQETYGNKDVRVGRLSKNSNRVPIRIPANGKRLSLKAGQEYDPETNRVKKSKSYKIYRNSGRIGYAKMP